MAHCEARLGCPQAHTHFAGEVVLPEMAAGSSLPGGTVKPELANCVAVPLAASLRLRPTETVKTARIIFPLRIAEIDRAAGQGIGLQRIPSGIVQVAAGHDHLAACPRDVESEEIAPHAET